jgi:hypothetical protein
MAVMSLDRLERVADVGTVAGKAASRSRTLHSARAVATASGVWFVRAGAAAMPLAVAGMAFHWPSAST